MVQVEIDAGRQGGNFESTFLITDFLVRALLRMAVIGSRG
jgi:hypothetical protein